MERRSSPQGVESETDGSVAVRLHGLRETASAPYPAVLWIHGGGFIIGSPAQDDAVCQVFAHKLGALVAAVRYRRAPEHPFPAALHDCHDGIGVARQARTTLTRPASPSGEPVRAGDWRLRWLCWPASVEWSRRASSSSHTPCSTTGQSCAPTSTSATSGCGTTRRTGSAGLRISAASPVPRASARWPHPPARRILSGLPPAWIGVGTLDLFFDEDMAYAKRLRTAGVPCELHVVEGAFHGFDSVAAKAGITPPSGSSRCRRLRPHSMSWADAKLNGAGATSRFNPRRCSAATVLHPSGPQLGVPTLGVSEAKCYVTFPRADLIPRTEGANGSVMQLEGGARTSAGCMGRIAVALAGMVGSSVILMSG